MMILRAEDIIIKIETGDIFSFREYMAAMQSRNAGEGVQITVIRKNKEIVLLVVPEEKH